MNLLESIDNLIKETEESQSRYIERRTSRLGKICDTKGWESNINDLIEELENLPHYYPPQPQYPSNYPPPQQLLKWHHPKRLLPAIGVVAGKQLYRSMTPGYSSQTIGQTFSDPKFWGTAAIGGVTGHALANVIS